MMFDMIPSEPLPAMTLPIFSRNRSGKDFAEVQPAVGVPVEILHVVPHFFEGEGGSAERVFIRASFTHP